MPNENLPPLSLYIHIPWCVKKCPYCDFNSYASDKTIPHFEYVKHLLDDLQENLPLIVPREINTIFIGGGTPTLLHSKAINILINHIKILLPISNNAEITIEANPETIYSNQFKYYQQAGINRISLGVQTFKQKHLELLCRNHGIKEIQYAIKAIKLLKLRSFNIDLMYGFTEQCLKEALDDLNQAIKYNIPHISWYQLTIEPNTLFYSCPPKLPDEDIIWDIFVHGHKLLESSGYYQYEVSAYSKLGYYCLHNLNYWRFGDYIGIGCGAHGKLTQLDGRIIRTIKTNHPRIFMKGIYLNKIWKVNESEIPFEYFLNRFRLIEPIPRKEFTDYTGISEDFIRPQIIQAISEGYITENNKNWQTTEKGKLFLNSLLQIFINNN
ncbi:radical SAM family heme chaperone HemW [Candidatus Ishikawella capsulata]|uniref:Heme chaperone HemW n=1 Tax=Candidatus Ishikawaella capsulata Mpkobe TaxID=476281 RepID=C5WDJ9_9ENTR|nr:radical SAM family heme chaperone HemW [Candidatus Ishikawaella capsulata]BAH83405.1 coproporphyrinogen III oxidase [Candidatus Ishikawaella capsulata Mpkobe]